VEAEVAQGAVAEEDQAACAAMAYPALLTRAVEAVVQQVRSAVVLAVLVALA
jgi:hypothetical protein